LINLGYNERRLLELLRGRGGMSRVELAREMEVSAPTLTRLTSNLLEIGLIREGKEQRNGGGRGKPSTRVELDPNGLYTLGVYFSPDDLRICVADFVGEIRAEFRQELASAGFTDTASVFGVNVALAWLMPVAVDGYIVVALVLIGSLLLLWQLDDGLYIGSETFREPGVLRGERHRRAHLGEELLTDPRVEQVGHAVDEHHPRLPPPQRGRQRRLVHGHAEPGAAGARVAL
jgi:hypothetical protein